MKTTLTSIGAFCVLAGSVIASTADLVTVQGHRLSVISDPDSKQVLAQDGRISTAVDVARSQRAYNQSFQTEVEPNNATTEATALSGSNLAAVGSIFPVGEVDYWSFQATAGDQIYVATMTAFSPVGASVDTKIALIDSDGTTVIERDDDNGSFPALASSIAGATIPKNGTYYLRVEGFNSVRPVTPYFLHFRVQSGSPVAEAEPNDSIGQANSLPASGFVSGTISTSADVDLFSLSLNAGDTVYLGLDLDPERDNIRWNGRLGLGLFNGQFVVVDDLGTNDAIPSEAFFMTVRDAGTYYVYVDPSTVGSATATYRLSVSVHASSAGNCTTYTSTDSAQAIPDGGSVTSTVTVPASQQIGDLAVDVALNHTLLSDLDVTLTSPAGNNNGLFREVGSSLYPNLDLRFSDDAGVSMQTTDYLDSMVVQPGGCQWVGNPLELICGGDYRLNWMKGEDAVGTWTLTVVDGTTNSQAGTLTSFGIRVCDPPAPPSCPGGASRATIYSQDFEGSNGSFTHSGTADEWEWGTPSFAPLDDCHSGANCWATDLNDTYNLNSSQDLYSPFINLASTRGPLDLSWAQKFQMEGASFDHAYVEIIPRGGTPTKIWEFQDGTMHMTQGTSVIQESAGWGIVTIDVSQWSCNSIQLHFHLDSDAVQNFAGFAVDDVKVTSCGRQSVDYIVGEGLGLPNTNRVRVYTGTQTATAVDFQAYGSNKWGTNVASGELNGDGFDEIVTGPGPGDVYGPHVRGWKRDGKPMGKVSFFAYGTLRFGVNVSSGDVDNDSFSEIVSGAGPGAVFGPHTRGWNFDANTISPIGRINFFAYQTLKWGVNPAIGNLDDDCYDEVLTGPGPGVIFGPQVRGWNSDVAPLTAMNINFNAYSLAGYGVNVTAGDVDDDGFDEIATAPGPGPTHPSEFKGFNYDGTKVKGMTGFQITPFSTLYGGRVGLGDVDQAGREELLAGAGRDPNATAEVLTFTYDGATLTQMPTTFTPFPGNYGVNVTSGELGY